MSNLLPQDFLNYEKRFIYVDAYHEPIKGTHPKWRRMKIDELQAFAKECHHYNVFATVQQFAIYKKTDNEEQYAPLYFDFDAKEPYTFKDVQEDVEKLKHYFLVAHNIDKSEMRFYFSGNRGMHVLINPITMNVEPHPELTYIFKNMSLYLKDLLDLHTLDPAVYSIRRVLRLVNSVHKTSGCYKVELDISEISLPEEEIRKLARSPRESLYEASAYIGISPNDSLKSFYKEFVDFYRRQTEINKLKPQKLIVKSDLYPVCIKDLLENSIKKSGTRNSATFYLSCYFKDQGLPVNKTFEIIYDWSQKIPKELTKTHGNELKAATKVCVASTYDDKTIEKNYHFVCSAIRTLGVQCNFDQCLIANVKDQEPQKIVEVDLSEASDGAFVNKKLSCRAMIVGKDTSPFLSPGRVQFICKEDEDEHKDENTESEVSKGKKSCISCLIKQQGGRMARDLPKTRQFILETINCASFQQEQLLKRLYVAGHASCPKLKVEVLEYRNIEEVELNPSVENYNNASEESEYVARKGFYIGHKIDVNQDYNIIGYVVPEPKTQHVVHIFDEAQPSETSLTSFKMNSEIKKRLEIFQVQKGQTVNDKFNEIYADFERNILHVWQRRAMFTAMDLVYHSVLRFELNSSLLQRGWTEVMIIGDSGQAKTDSYLKLRNHYGLGVRVSGEGSRRTGLAWTWQQTAKRWFVKFGIIPNNDRRLVCIDEAAGMSEEELEKLTDMREQGIADATGGPIPAKAYARTRLIWMSNARNGQSLRTFMFPIESIQGVFKKSEDIRRLDFCIGVVTGVVSDNIIHQNSADMPEIQHKFTSDLCHQLILWAWTRKPNEVIITKEASNAIRDTALMFGRRYSAKIPIVETAVQRIKIARLSVAAAARVFSTSSNDKEGNTLVVLPEHVQFISDFLINQYDDSVSLDYLNYTINNRLDSDAIYDLAYNDYAKLPEVKQLTSILKTTKYWVKNDLGDMVGLDRDNLQKVMKVLAQYRLIEKVKGQYRMTTAGVDFVKRFDIDKRALPEIKTNEQGEQNDNKDDLIDFLNN